MKVNRIHKSLYVLFGALFLIVLLGFGFILLKTYRESKVFQQNEINLQDNLNRLKKEVGIQERYLKRFNDDPAFFEWVARQRIGYVERGEIVFRFGDEEVDGYTNSHSKK